MTIIVAASVLVEWVVSNHYTTCDAMKKTGMDHLVTNALLRIEGVAGQPPPRFEKPSADLDFWVLELRKYQPEKLTKWQKRVMPILRRLAPVLKKWRQAGSRCCLHVQTDSPMPMFPAVFQAGLIAILAEIGCTLEHGVETAPE